jgi:hypothetical protein
MTNQNEDDGKVDGAQGSPNSNVSETKSKSFEGSQELREFLQAELRSALETPLKELRGLQGKQDKTDKALREFTKEYQKQIKAGLSEDDAIAAAQDVQQRTERATKREQLIDELLAEKFGGKKPEGNGSNPAIAQAKALAQKYGLDENDEALAQIVSNSKVEELEGKIAIHVLNQKQASPAGAPSLKAGAQNKETIEGLTKQYINDMQAARGDRLKLTEIKKKAIQNGVPVDTISFS